MPEVSGSDAGKVLTVGLNGEWLAAEPLRQVQRINYYAAASGTHAQGDLTIVDGKNVYDKKQENYCCYNNNCIHRWVIWVLYNF